MFIDLSMPVNEKTVVFPGDANPVFEPAGTMETTDFVDHVIHINNHLGTHIDAPGHMVKGGKKLSDFKIDQFIHEAICIDARNHKTLTDTLLEGIEVVAGSAILFYTGRGEEYQKSEYATNYPPIDERLSNLLVQKGVAMVGVDMISYDHDAPFPIHKALLGKGILLIENLVNLSKICGKRFRLYALPINLELEAAPARVIAEII